MRNAALMLGIIGGIFGMFIGFFSYGYVALTEQQSAVGEIFGFVSQPELIKVAGFAGPLLAIAGGAMARARALWGGILLIAAGVVFYVGFGFTFATMFPIGMTLLGGVLAIAAGKPDEEKAHF